MIKILYIIDKMKPAGAQRHLEQVMVGLDKTKFEPRLVTLEEFGVRRIYGLCGIRGVFGLVRFIKKEHFDIVHTYLFSANVFGNLAAKIAGVPIIISGRRDVGLHREGKWQHRLIYRFAHGLATRVVAVSNAVKDVIVREEGVAPEKVEVIYNGVNCEKIERRRVKGEGREKLKDQLGIKPDEFVVGMVANFSWVKGHEVLIKAVREVVKEVPIVKFLLIGEGTLRERCEMQAVSYGLLEAKPSQALSEAVPGRLSLSSDKIKFLGKRDDVPELLSIMDVSLNLSYSEGMSNTILESMAAGVPVVATAVDGNLETVDENTGLLVRIKDPRVTAQAIVRLLKDEVLRKRLSENASRKVREKFSIGAMLKNMEELYCRLAKEKGLQ